MAEHVKYLFLCHGGAKRSPTAASVAHETALEKGLNIEMVYGSADAMRQGNPEAMAKHISEFQKVYPMEKDIADYLEVIGVKSEIYCLDIPDNYERQDKDLRQVLREKLEDKI